MHAILAARSSFSIGESILDVADLVDQAKKAGATAVALTDTMSVTGLIDFTNRCKKAEIKPIIGVRLRLVDDPTWRKPKKGDPGYELKVKTPPEYYVTAYALTEVGLKAIYRLLTLANTEERFYNTAKLGFGDLMNELRAIGQDDLAIATGDIQSVLTHPKAVDIIKIWQKLIAHVYVTLTPINTPYFDTLNKKAIALAKELNVPTLVTRPVAYGENDADALTIMNAVSRNVKLSEPWVWSPVYKNLHCLNYGATVVQLIAAHKRLAMRGCDEGEIWRNGLNNTDTLAESVRFTWSKQPVSLPKMAEDEFATLVAECRKGFVERLGRITFGHKPSAEDVKNIYHPRLIYELGVLKKLGFAGYFLLVQDIVRFAKTSGILVGPGRGSVGGSLVAYLIGITDCDPIRFGLIFERFINPERIDLPDADLDFMSTRRGEIVDYLTAKYGKERVAGISNFNSLAAASTIRDVGKVFGLSEDDIRCSKYVEKKHGANVPLKDQILLVNEIKEFSEKFDPIWKVCLKIEGAIKSLGRHAAGVVVGGCDLVERSVVEHRKDGATVNWDKRIVEDQGLVKVDILGLETLDLINLTLGYIGKRSGKKIDLLQIPLDDTKVLDNFARGKTTGVFQFESGGMRRLLKELGKDGTITFDDITAATALYRPGPMESGMMDSYWKRKQGLETVEYDHPLMEPILKPTYGVMVYQEQVMQVSRAVAGYTGPEADKLRKIMGKKLPEEMKKERGKFVDGCVKTIGCTSEWAGDLFDKIEGFAGYGFNKSHSVEYTLISYQSMWLKTNFPVEFYAAALSLMKEDKLPALLKDATEFGIEVEVPDVNVSGIHFEILNDRVICIPFSRVKGLTENTANAILEARKTNGGSFKSKADFVNLVNRRIVNSAKVEALDKIGAFAKIEPASPAVNSPSRVKDQRELIPGLISSVVPIKRDMHTDKLTKVEVIKTVHEYQGMHEKDGRCVKPLFGKNARFMAIFDAPGSGEERNGQMTLSDNFEWTYQALVEAGLDRADGYWTALIKRPKEGKQVSAGEIKTYEGYLEKEIALLKPPVIVLLGSGVVRHFFPDFKGKASDAAGKIIYAEKLDANIVIGFNPGEIFHDGDKQVVLDEVFRQVANLLS
jgi:DNA polymerase-3 subunit alpha